MGQMKTVVAGGCVGAGSYNVVYGTALEKLTFVVFVLG